MATKQTPKGKTPPAKMPAKPAAKPALKLKTKPVAPPPPPTKKKYTEIGDDDMSASRYARGGKVKKMATGGFVRAADGVATKGKTKAKQIAMKKGGKC